MKKGLLGPFLLFLWPGSVIHALVAAKDDGHKRTKMEKMLDTLPDSAYEKVRKEDLLQDEVYVKLARDGWNNEEIRRIMDNYLKYHKSKVKGTHVYGLYAKQWLPTYGYTPGGDSLYQFVDTTWNARSVKSLCTLFANQMSDYYPEIPYTPDDRKRKIRRKGYFRPVFQNPNSGRIHWIVVDPKSSDHLMVVPDGGGIFRTDDLGKTWKCVTDRIPDRVFRKVCGHSAIPVDPDDWNHFFAFMKGNGNAVFETTDGGESWTRVGQKGRWATHKDFKRGYAFKDKEGHLKFIGATQSWNYMYNQLWISADKGVTWDEIVVPDHLKEVHPENGSKGGFFQNFAFDPTNRDMVYIPTSRSIFYLDDGGRPEVVNGKNTYHIKKMVFDVYDQDGTTCRAKQVNEFPFKATSQGFLEVNPNNPKEMWFASGSRGVSYGSYSAVYHSTDGGKTWITLQEPYSGIGSGLAFGNEVPWGWLGGFGVNFKNQNKIYGCSMSSAKSQDGGKNFRDFGWGNRMRAWNEEAGDFYHVTSARHNADNHCIVSHADGRVFRGSDAGLLMIDDQVNGGEWTNINGPMGNQLHYSIKVNEFGDQIMLGNTQDVDAQTYKYGRWENWRGYEGTEAFINPYGSTCYFSGGGGGGLDGIEYSSWKEGYTMADVCTGNWYLIHEQSNGSLFRIEDFGREPVNITANSKDETGTGAGAKAFALSRKGGHPVLYVYNNNNTVVRSEDNGETFTTVKVKVNGKLIPANYPNSRIAVDPENDILYLGQKASGSAGAKVLKIDPRTGDIEDLSAGLPQTNCKELFFHEGSGDLYFFSDMGLFLRAHDKNTWELWLKGYNPLVDGRLALNYTTQEMVIGDYGRGVWVADLEHPSDRYFRNGFALKELSCVAGRTTVGIDTKLTVPMYYEYEWFVNDIRQDVPYQYLTAPLQKGDRVRLKLTLRESPDVTTESAEYVVGASDVPEWSVRPRSGKALYSDGHGRVDLGYVDYFYNDFTVDFWIRPESDGVILANRPVDVDKDTRGWAIMIENGSLKFRYAPANLMNLPTYEKGFEQQKDVVIQDKLSYGQWYHVALTEDRDGQIVFFLNGIRKAEADRIRPDYPLNAAVYLSLFADGYERRPIRAAVDGLRIWKKALRDREVQRAMYSYESGQADQLVFYHDFNQGELGKEQEIFTRSGMKSRTRAVTSYIDMPVNMSARWSDARDLEGTTRFESGSHYLLSLTSHKQTAAHAMAVYQYELDSDHAVPGLDSRYYVAASDMYQIRSFSAQGLQDELTVSLPGSYKSDESYMLYVADVDAPEKEWIQITPMEVQEDGKALLARQVPMSALQNKLLLALTYKPAIDSRISGQEGETHLYVYDKKNTVYSLNAFTVSGLKEPVNDYALKSEKGHLLMQSPLHFVQGKAETTFSVDTRTLNHRLVTDHLQAAEGDLFIPKKIHIHNLILPEDAGEQATVEWGGLVLDQPEIYQQMNGSNTLTMMGWFKIDDLNTLQGVKPLMFFRGASPNVCGLHLADGQLRFHWNDKWWNWSSSLSLTQKDLGQWVHLAMVVAPDHISLFLNGQEHRHNTQVEPAKIQTPFLLAQNKWGDTWFKGAMDQISLWKRSLTSEEVRRYMLQSPLLNADGLLALIDMDNRHAENGRVQDQLTELPLHHVGKVSFNKSHMPYLFREQYEQHIKDGEDEQRPLYLRQPVAYALGCTFSILDGNAYNYVSTQRPDLYPFLPEHYVMAYHDKPDYRTDEPVKLVVRRSGITAQDRLTLAVRPLGSVNEFATFVSAESVEAGRAVFVLPRTILTGSLEMMVMADADAATRPEKVDVSVYNWNEMKPVQSGETLFLDENEDEFIIKTHVASINPGSHVTISIVENEYASLEQELNLKEQTEQSFKVKLNREALDPLAENPVTIRLNGISESSKFAFNVAFLPEVRLTYKNEFLPEDHHLVVDSVFHTEDIHAELVRGVLKDGVQLRAVVGDGHQQKDKGLKMSFNTNIGTLVSNDIVHIKNPLHFYKSAKVEDEGWNLIGNPYLANLNMTKSQNVQIDESYLLKYLYEYEPETDTYRAWDMLENYDATQDIKPLQPFFVVTRQPGAQLTVTSEAKNQQINRRVFDHYRLHDMKSLQLVLLDEEQQLCDRTEVRFYPESHTAFVLGEDAVKLWGGINARANEMATVASGGEYVSVNVLPDFYVEVPVYLKLSRKGSFRLAISSKDGFYLGKHQVRLYDKKLKQYHDLLRDNSYVFDVAHPDEALTRFALCIDIRQQTGIATSGQDESVTITSDGVALTGLKGKSCIEIFDAVGRRFSYEITTGSCYSKQLPPGTYILHVRTDNSDYSKKIVIK